MTVHVETTPAGDSHLLSDTVTEVTHLLRERLGVGVSVVGEAPGALSQATGIEQRQKPLRLRDDRKDQS